ncbi:MAG: hypothetical protein ACJA13_004078 [Paraglaciecola sp.]|jgi:hypothetical protein
MDINKHLPPVGQVCQPGGFTLSTTNNVKSRNDKDVGIEY